MENWNYETKEAYLILVNTESLYNQLMTGTETWVLLSMSSKFDHIDQGKIDTSAIAEIIENDDNYNFVYNHR